MFRKLDHLRVEKLLSWTHSDRAVPETFPFAHLWSNKRPVGPFETLQTRGVPSLRTSQPFPCLVFSRRCSPVSFSSVHLTGLGSARDARFERAPERLKHWCLQSVFDHHHHHHHHRFGHMKNHSLLPPYRRTRCPVPRRAPPGLKLHGHQPQLDDLGRVHHRSGRRSPDDGAWSVLPGSELVAVPFWPRLMWS